MEDRLALVIHELRSPVAALVAIADAFAAERSALSPDQARRFLELAVAAGRSIDRLVTDEDAFSVVVERLALAPLLEEVTCGRAELEAGPALYVRGDPVRLRQAVSNLIDNGLRHGSSVRVVARADDHTIRIAVSDDGPGTPEGIDVFAPGVSGVGSTGYGLAVVRTIAERHGGRVELLSEPGVGATFTLVLPSGAG